MESELRALIERHRTTLSRQVTALGRLLTRLDQPAANPLAVIGEARDLAHQLAGSSGSIGFAQVGAAAEALATRLKLLQAAGVPPGADERRRLYALFDELDRIAEQTTPQDSRLYDAELPPRAG